MEYFLMFLFNLVLIVGMFFYLKGMIKKELSSKSYLKEIQGDVDALIKELNLTAERNIGLLEDRVRQLNGVFERADQKMVLLGKETSRLEKSKDVYTQLASKKPLNVVPNPQVPLPLETGFESAQIIDKPILKDTPPLEVKTPPQKTVKEKVRELYDAGISPSMISSSLGLTLAEVELFISLLRGL